jgi:hypothetical protein
MPEDYLSDAPEAEAAPESEAKSDVKTALLPVAFFQGKELEPGTVCKIKIESVEDDQAQVSYVPHEEREEMKGDLEEAPAAAPEEYMG